MILHNYFECTNSLCQVDYLFKYIVSTIVVRNQWVASNGPSIRYIRGRGRDLRVPWKYPHADSFFRPSSQVEISTSHLANRTRSIKLWMKYFKLLLQMYSNFCRISLNRWLQMNTSNDTHITYSDGYQFHQMKNNRFQSYCLQMDNLLYTNFILNTSNGLSLVHVIVLDSEEENVDE